MKQFKIEINLDDPIEREEFINRHGTMKGRSLANRLSLDGKGSALLATSLSNYAWNAFTAYRLRQNGEIETAKIYEEIMDKIYKNDIQPICECW